MRSASEMTETMSVSASRFSTDTRCSGLTMTIAITLGMGDFGHPVYRVEVPSLETRILVAAMLNAGSRLGPYEVVGQIGAGGMGEVYQATDSRLKRAVAIKILPAPVAADADRLARFRREAEVLAALNHPNIAAIYGLEETDSGIALVMELVEGPTLADRIRQGALPTDEALQVARQTADALEAAHDIGIVHRDLKPANIKVRPDGTVKVLDFGLAKAIDRDRGSAIRDPAESANSPTITTPAMTQAGMILGTAAYMSPEQARGRVVDRRTDIWAFGCVLFEMLTGRRAFDGEDVTETLAAIVKDTPSWSALPPLPPLVELFLKQSLEKDPRKRLGDMRDMRLALSGELALAPEAAPRRRSSLAGAAALVLATVAIVAVAAMAMWPAAPPLRERSRASSIRFPIYRHSPAASLPSRQTAGESSTRRVPAFSCDRWMKSTRVNWSPAARRARHVGDMVLSPDGQWLAYVAGQELSKVPVSGGAPVPLANVGIVSGASWTSDGAILYGHQQGIMRVPENGGSPEVFVRASDGEQMHLPQLLPDGDSVLFTVTKDRGINRWMQAQVVVQSLPNRTAHGARRRRHRRPLPPERPPRLRARCRVIRFGVRREEAGLEGRDGVVASGCAAADRNLLGRGQLRRVERRHIGLREALFIVALAGVGRSS